MSFFNNSGRSYSQNIEVSLMASEKNTITLLMLRVEAIVLDRDCHKYFVKL